MDTIKLNESFMKKLILIFCTLISTTLFSAHSQPKANQEYLKFMRQSCKKISRGLSRITPASQIAETELLSRNIPALQAIVQQAQIVLLIDNSYSFTNPNQSQQIQCVGLRQKINRYDDVLKTYQKALCRYSSDNQTTN